MTTHYCVLPTINTYNNDHITHSIRMNWQRQTKLNTADISLHNIITVVRRAVLVENMLTSCSTITVIDYDVHIFIFKVVV